MMLKWLRLLNEQVSPYLQSSVNRNEAITLEIYNLLHTRISIQSDVPAANRDRKFR